MGDFWIIIYATSSAVLAVGVIGGFLAYFIKAKWDQNIGIVKKSFLKSLEIEIEKYDKKKKELNEEKEKLAALNYKIIENKVETCLNTINAAESVTNIKREKTAVAIGQINTSITGIEKRLDKLEL